MEIGDRRESAVGGGRAANESRLGADGGKSERIRSVTILAQKIKKTHFFPVPLPRIRRGPPLFSTTVQRHVF